MDDRYVECESCGERFVGEAAISNYIREIVGDDGELVHVCTTCLGEEQ